MLIFENLYNLFMILRKKYIIFLILIYIYMRINVYNNTYHNFYLTYYLIPHKNYIKIILLLSYHVISLSYVILLSNHITPTNQLLNIY